MAVKLFVNQLRSGKTKQEIHVKIIQKWMHGNNTVDEAIKMILVDTKGDKILATIKNDCVDILQPRFHKGQWKSISKFRVNEVEDDYDLRTTNQYEIMFDYYTVVQPLEPQSQDSFLDFISFHDIKNGLFNPKYRCDLIGKVLKVDEVYYHYDRTEENRFSDWATFSFYMEDEYGRVMECLTMGDHALKFYNQYKNRNINVPQVCVLRCIRINTHNEEIEVQTLGECSEVFLNPDMIEVQQFLDRCVINLDDYESTGETSG